MAIQNLTSPTKSTKSISAMAKDLMEILEVKIENKEVGATGFHLWQMGFQVFDEETAFSNKEVDLSEEVDFSSSAQAGALLIALEFLKVLKEKGLEESYFLYDVKEASDKGTLLTDSFAFAGENKSGYGFKPEYLPNWESIMEDIGDYEVLLSSKNLQVEINEKGELLSELLLAKNPDLKIIDFPALQMRLNPSFSLEEWVRIFKEGSPMIYSDGSFALPGYGAEFVVKPDYELNKLNMLVPQFESRHGVYFIANSMLVMDTLDVWGNMLLETCLTGATRDYVGALLRRDGTNLTVPSSNYGEKSSYNKKVERSKHGILNFTVSMGASSYGIRSRFENSKDPYAVHKAYEFLIEKGIPSFPQHQGDDVRSGMAALASEVSLVTYKGIQFFVFGRAIDKITKVFNRCSLLNRVGVTGVIHNNLDDR